MISKQTIRTEMTFRNNPFDLVTLLTTGMIVCVHVCVNQLGSSALRSAEGKKLHGWGRPLHPDPTCTEGSWA